MTEAILTQEKIIEDLFSRGKVCLTATNLLPMETKYRFFSALFADGTFLIDEQVKFDAAVAEIVQDFWFRYKPQRSSCTQYVTADFLKAVYRKAQEFDWYAPQYKLPQNLSKEQKDKLRQFVRRVTSGSVCLSVTTVQTPDIMRFYSPDRARFALFDNGRLVVSEQSPYIDELSADLCRLYPQTCLIEQVPDYYVSAIYESLLYVQPSAREIYKEVIIGKYMKKHNLSREEALAVLRRQPEGWQRVLIIDEVKARSMIYSEYAEYCLARDDKVWAELMNKKDIKIGSFV